MSAGYVFIVANPAERERIFVGSYAGLPSVALNEFKLKYNNDDLYIPWFLSLNDSELGLRMIRFKLRPFVNNTDSDLYNIGADFALSLFFKDIVDFFEIFKYRQEVFWSIGKPITYQELCLRSNIEKMYPVLWRTYIRNKISISKRNNEF